MGIEESNRIGRCKVNRGKTNVNLTFFLSTFRQKIVPEHRGILMFRNYFPSTLINTDLIVKHQSETKKHHHGTR